jgi:hypothetical protein
METVQKATLCYAPSCSASWGGAQSGERTEGGVVGCISEHRARAVADAQSRRTRGTHPEHRVEGRGEEQLKHAPAAFKSKGRGVARAAGKAQDGGRG